MDRTILVIEDEPSIADNIVYALKTEGFSVVRAETACEAQVILESVDVVLILLDVGLPDRNGFDLARDIKQKRDTPIIFLTARSSEVDRVVGLELGADDYVVKPFSPRELSARVRAVLRRMKPATASNDDKSKVMSLSIVEDKRVIAYEGTPLDLARYEYEILKVLLHSPGRVFTREHLMALVWEQPEMSSERTVDTHIKTIRRKLKQAGAFEDSIVTHRGVGYSLRESE